MKVELQYNFAVWRSFVTTFLACSCHSPIPIGLFGLLSSTPRPKLRKPTFTVASKHTYTTLSSFLHSLAYSRSTPPLANTPTARIIVALNKDHSIVYLLVLPQFGTSNCLALKLTTLRSFLT